MNPGNAPCTCAQAFKLSSGEIRARYEKVFHLDLNDFPITAAVEDKKQDIKKSANEQHTPVLRWERKRKKGKKEKDTGKDLKDVLPEKGEMLLEALESAKVIKKEKDTGKDLKDVLPEEGKMLLEALESAKVIDPEMVDPEMVDPEMVDPEMVEISFEEAVKSGLKPGLMWPGHPLNATNWFEPWIKEGDYIKGGIYYYTHAPPQIKYQVPIFSLIAVC